MCICVHTYINIYINTYIHIVTYRKGGCRLHLSCSVLQCVALCCGVLQCVAECCSVLQCVAVHLSLLHLSCSAPLSCTTLGSLLHKRPLWCSAPLLHLHGRCRRCARGCRQEALAIMIIDHHLHMQECETVVDVPDIEVCTHNLHLCVGVGVCTLTQTCVH